MTSRIRTAQQRAISAANRELVLLYWHASGINIMAARQAKQGWGSRAID